MKTSTQLIVALDVDTAAQACHMAAQMSATVKWVKIGKQLFTRQGPEIVRELKGMGKKVFLDLKFHDIPNTVGQAVRAAAEIGADMTNVHASGGPEMLKAAAAAAVGTPLILIAVTVLTSMDAQTLAAVGVPRSPEEQVLELAKLTRAAGVHGVVCSALEITAIRRACGENFVLVVPGIRPAGSGHGDQKRVMTPAEAVRAGADFIVVGRPITGAPSPGDAAAAILQEMQAAEL